MRHTNQHEIDGLKARCPHCKRKPGQHCVNPDKSQYGGYLTLKLHKKRLEAGQVEEKK